MQNVVRERVALGLSNSDTPASVLAPEALDAALADGTLQVAAGQAWRAAPGTKPFRAQVGLQQDEADSVFRSVVDQRLKAAGFAEGINGTLDITYVDDPQGRPHLAVLARDADHNRGRAIIALDDFKAEHRKSLPRQEDRQGASAWRGVAYER